MICEGSPVKKNTLQIAARPQKHVQECICCLEKAHNHNKTRFTRKHTCLLGVTEEEHQELSMVGLKGDGGEWLEGEGGDRRKKNCKWDNMPLRALFFKNNFEDIDC